MLSFGEGHQLLRIPYLVKHFQKHQLADPEMTVVKFIQIHYIYPIQQTDDFQQDQQLPFRSIDSNLLNISQSSIEPLEIESPEFTEASHEFHYFNEKNPGLIKGFDIFQPPRYA